MMSIAQNPQQTLYLPPGVSLPREQLAMVQHILNEAMRAATTSNPPPPYNPRGAGQWFRPRMDMYEASGAVTATFELPGLRKEDIHIDVVDGRMVVVGERLCGIPVGGRDDDDDEHEMSRSSPTEEMRMYEGSVGYTVREIKRGRFKRIVQLPTGIKLDDIKASMHDGILTVTFPGAPRPVVRSIPIS